MKTRALFLASVVLVSFIFSTKSHAQVGITAVPFLQIEPDTRTAGMGNAGVAVADESAAVFWNPAGLAFQSGTEINNTYAKWLPQFDVGLFYLYMAGKSEVEGLGTFGGHITYLNLGEQVHTDGTGQVLGKFTSYEIAIGASYGFQLTRNLGLGTGIRYIHSNLVPAGLGTEAQPASNGSSVALDLGALYRTDPFRVFDLDANLRLGFNLSNIGPAIQYVDEAQRDPLPTLLRVGWAYSMNLDAEGYNMITISNDISKLMARTEMVIADGDTTFQAMPVTKALFNSWDNIERFNGLEMVEVPLRDQFMIGLGLEYWYNRLFALRTGYFYEAENNGGRQFLTFGAGLRYDFLGIDFSYLATLEENHPLANTIRLSLMFNL